MTFDVRFAILNFVSVASPAWSPVLSQTVKSHETVEINWTTLGVDQSQDAVIIDRKSPILFTRVAPKDVFISSVDMRDGPLRFTSGGNAVPVGTLLARVSYPTDRFCEPARRRKQNFIYCVEDSDRDGTLDTISGVPTMVISRNTRTNYEILVGRMSTSFSARLESSVKTSSLSPVSVSEQIKFDVMLTQKDKKSIALCIWRYAGNALIDGLGNAPFCGPSWNLTALDFPKTIAIYGGQIQLSRSGSGEIQAKIVPPPAGMSFPG